MKWYWKTFMKIAAILCIGFVLGILIPYYYNIDYYIPVFVGNICGMICTLIFLQDKPLDRR